MIIGSFNVPFVFQLAKKVCNVSSIQYSLIFELNPRASFWYIFSKLQINEYEYLEYKAGDKDKLTATFVPKEVEVPKIENGYKWKSSMSNVVKVDNEGNIEALRDGVATISVTYGTYSAKCIIVVGEVVNLKNRDRPRFFF